MNVISKFGCLLVSVVGLMLTSCDQVGTGNSMLNNNISSEREPPSDFSTLLGVSEENAPNETLINWLKKYSEDETKIHHEKLDLQANLIDISNFEFSQVLVDSIAKSNSIEWLRIGKRGTGNVLGWVVKLKQLKGLSLRNAKLDDGDLKKLKSLDGLRWLDLWGVEIGSDKLPSLPNLEVLILDTEMATDELIPAPGQFPKLKALSLTHSKITDKGIEKLAISNPRIRYLNIAHTTNVTSKSVAALSKLTGLQYLHIGNTALERQRLNESVHAVDKIKLALPSCFVGIGD